MKRISVLVLGSLAFAAPALADARDDVLANTARCGRIADPRQWLDCYYGAAQPMRAQLGLSPAPQVQTRLGAAPAMAPTYAPQQQAVAAPPIPRKERGGILSGLFGGATEIAAVHASAYSFDKKGIFTITLADGEVWEQLSDDNSYAQWRDPAARLSITIKKGAMGSDNLQVAGDNHLYKVRRVR